MYWDAVERVMKVLDDNHPKGGLVPIFVNPATGHYQGNLIRLGSRGDSYYEYLLKQYLQTGESIYLEMYLETFDGIKKYLMNKSYPNGLTFLGERERGVDGPFSNKMDHLVCFIGGLFALGATEGQTYQEAKALPSWNEKSQDQMDLAEEMGYTCYKMYHDVPTGLSPEIVVFNTDAKNRKDFTIKMADRHNLQRPETVETLFYLWKITGNIKYREWGWEIFENFVKYTKVTSGGKDGKPRYTSLDDVTSIPPRYRDNMESFWLAETLKYLYLLFDDSDDPRWDIKNVVFNTEAHPLPQFEMGDNFKTGWTRYGNLAEKPPSKLADKVEKPAAKKIEQQQVQAPLRDTAPSNLDDEAAAMMKDIKNAKAAGDVKPQLDDGKAGLVADLSDSKPVIEKQVDSEGSIDDFGKEKEKAVQGSKLVAEEIKQKGEIPVAKQPVAKPLNEQVDQVMNEE
ncbi:unnamed protein product [Ambrosiozyma monospora]|uniref:Unnamed protein product n=1 Tax=Ambrosiozyma monospora TaxID=43982 RepID=A0ACB5SWP1_AMBMO|nr:unnamed protein product [Ambrosiozyma monospora]